MVTLYLLVGIPACGKSTRASMHKAAGREVLSSDELRAVLGKDETDQSVSKEVFQVMHGMAGYLLSQGRDVVIDATNVTVLARKPFIEMARKYGAEVVAEVIDTPVRECLVRNRLRTRVVPEDVIHKMSNRFEVPTLAEVDDRTFH